MARVRGGDRKAFEALYSKYGSPVMRFLFRFCGNRALAEDMTQEVFLKVWRAAAGWRPLGRVSTWLFQIAKHHAWNEVAKRSRRKARWSRIVDDASNAARTAEHGGLPAEHLARREARSAITDALAALSPKLRLVFVLLRLEGLSLAETAEVAGIPVGTVKSRAAAAEAALRKRLRRTQP